MTTKTNHISLWDRIMTAITFAEANDENTARELIGAGTDERRPQSRTVQQAARRLELQT